ncbi:MAG: hypothetical protein LBQ39_05755, partial [Tannerellaceae bacterium]|nr:hypothetical protein [Tannerellaceae bacterium]
MDSFEDFVLGKAQEEALRREKAAREKAEAEVQKAAEEIRRLKAEIEAQKAEIKAAAEKTAGAHAQKATQERTAQKKLDPFEDLVFGNAQEKAAKRDLRTLTGHQDDVNSVAYSPDGRRIVSGSGSGSLFEFVDKDNTITIWDAESRRDLRILRGHQYSVLSVAYSPDGRHIVSGSWDNTIKIWDAESG